MAFNIRNRNFLKLLDFTPAEIKFLLKLSADLKAAKYGGYEKPRLKGKNIALIFEKSSTRTRTAFEVAAFDQGAHVTYLGPSGSQIGHKESMKDTARVLGRMYDGIENRFFIRVVKNNSAQAFPVYPFVGRQNRFPECREDIRISRATRFDHFSGYFIRVDNSRTGIFQKSGNGGFPAGNASRKADDNQYLSFLNGLESDYFIVTTGQGALMIIYWALEPNSNLPTFDRRLMPMTISSNPFSLA